MATLSAGFCDGVVGPLADYGTSAVSQAKEPGALAGPAGPQVQPNAAMFRGKNGHYIRQTDAAVVVVYRFHMRAEDANDVPGTLRNWVVTGEPDFTANEYMGPFAGASVNFTNIHIAMAWRVIQE